MSGCIKKIERKIDCALDRRNLTHSTIYENKERQITVVCFSVTPIDHNNIGDSGSFPKFRSPHKDNLSIYENGYVGFCYGPDNTLLIPKRDFFKILDVLPSVNDEGLDFFIRLEKRENEFFIDTRNPDNPSISVIEYLI